MATRQLKRCINAMYPACTTGQPSSAFGLFCRIGIHRSIHPLSVTRIPNLEPRQHATTPRPSIVSKLTAGVPEEITCQRPQHMAINQSTRTLLSLGTDQRFGSCGRSAVEPLPSEFPPISNVEPSISSYCLSSSSGETPRLRCRIHSGWLPTKFLKILRLCRELLISLGHRHHWQPRKPWLNSLFV